MSGRIPAVVLGGTGYVAGELLRLIAGHPQLRLAAVMSESQPGEPLAGAFPHLASAYPEARFSSEEEVSRLLCAARESALFSAAPHGVSAALVDRVLAAAEQAGAAPRVVDISADFRYPNAESYEAVYRHPHGAPARIPQFTCAVPEHLARLGTPHVGHPGCFATAILLAAVPLLAAGLVTPLLFVSGTTGSTGSGRKPIEGTHHPLRHSDLYAYSALAHRHVPEVIACARAATGVQAEFAFIPHSGPFARGIHVTLQAQLRRSLDTEAALTALRAFYAHLSAVARGGTLAVVCVIDNLCKGAAGGAIQWMNRMFDLPETAGLAAPAPGWT
jgi:N-acetyl-gamma-glutamyl-phosphate reductase common form